MERALLIVAASVTAVFVISLIKRSFPELATAASLCAGVAVLVYVLGDLQGITEHLRSFCENAIIREDWIKSITKITFICFIGQWGAQLCRDAGENSIADKTETAVKIIITVICLPYIDELLKFVEKIE